MIEWRSREQLRSDLAAISEGFCPDCLQPLAEYGWCWRCIQKWELFWSFDGVPGISHSFGGSLVYYFVEHQ